MQAAETPFRAAANIMSNLVARRISQKEYDKQKEYEKLKRDIEEDEQNPPEFKERHYGVGTSPREQEPEEPREREKEGPEETPAPKKPFYRRKNEYLMLNEQQPKKQEDGVKPVNVEELETDSTLHSVEDQLSRTKKPFKPTENKSAKKYLNTSDLIIIAKLKRRGI
jgi:hypothetical protein